MLEWEDQGIVLSLRNHGETGGILSVLTEKHGRASGYVYGAASGKVRGTLEQGSVVSLHWQAKNENQLGHFSVEPVTNFTADVMDDALKLTAMQSALALADRALPEGENYTGVFHGLLALLHAFKTDIWAPTYVFWEMGLLRELGFGLDLTHCVSTGATEDLLYVSPKSGCAVSSAAGEPYKEKLLALPSFLRGEGRFENSDILEGLCLTGHFLRHRIFFQANTNLPEPRLRLEEKYVKQRADN